MDKRVIFAVAGSGKTTYIVDSLSTEKRSLIVTYTTGNFDNLSKKIADKFDGKWPDNITLLSYFQFLYRFCYKPFLADRIRARGIIYDEKLIPQYAKQTDRCFFLTPGDYFHSNRLAFFLDKYLSKEIKARIETYYDEFIIDEVQDIAGRDFNFLEKLMMTNVNILFVGDFFQHTYDTSRDGNANKNLFDDRAKYEARFTQKGIIPDTTTLKNSWRCSPSVCEFVSINLGIQISSNISEERNTEIRFIEDPTEKAEILSNSNIIKLHYQESQKYGFDHRNWGETKGEDHYQDVCVMLNKKTAKLYRQGKLNELPPSTRNKLYVAITRAHGNVYFIPE